jgi:hypothetical protein
MSDGVHFRTRKDLQMPGKAERLHRAFSAVRRLFHRDREVEAPAEAAPRENAAARVAEPRPQREVAQARPARRPSDIGLDVLSRTYTPPLASGKSGFRSDGADHQRDQQFAAGYGDERWNDEDRFTNKSGDPRIGTHGRTYEAGESRGDSRDD